MQESKVDPLLDGFFTTSEVVRLMKKSRSVLTGWLDGYYNSQSGSIIDRDFKGTHTISFLDLMEIRFIKYFRGQGVSMQTLRKASQKAREQWGVTHPLAMSDEKYLTDRKNIFAQIAEQEDDEITYNLVTGQHEMWVIIEKYIAKDIVFDPSEYHAKSWKPLPNVCPDVIIDPGIAFGRATVENYRVPTSVLFSQYKAEQKNMDIVADWFNVPVEAVETSIRYELELST